MAEKTSILKMLEGLRGLQVYDEYTWAKLELLAARAGVPADLGRKEREVIGEVFARFIERTEISGQISFSSLAGGDSATKGMVVCTITSFLGLGNTGPVYAVTVGGQSYALKMYSAERVKGMLQTHGKFGLGGILQDLESQDRPTGLSDLGKRVFRKRPTDVYGRCKRLVRVHDVGADSDFMYLLMDLLDVDPISKTDLGKPGGTILDAATWCIDCCTALCQLHVEEQRLHLNIRPEAFIRQTVKDSARLPKYAFFQYPKKFVRSAGSPSLTTEFIMVDHLDSSVDIADKGPHGLGTVGSWHFVAPEQILQLLKALKGGYGAFVEQGMRPEQPVTVKLRRTQLDDIWALGLTFYQFLSGGKHPCGDARHLADMVNAILLSKFDFAPIDPRLRTVVAAMLEKDPQKRAQSLAESCPQKIQSRHILAECVLYQLEEIALAAQE